MSSIAQGVTAVKQCKLPPLFGYKTVVPQGAVKTLSTDNFANLTANQRKIHQNFQLLTLNIWKSRARSKTIYNNNQPLVPKFWGQLRLYDPLNKLMSDMASQIPNNKKMSILLMKFGCYTVEEIAIKLLFRQFTVIQEE